MSNFNYSFFYLVNTISVFCASIIGMIFWKKQRTKESMIFALGILLVALGTLIPIFEILILTLISCAGETTAQPGYLIWHIATVVKSIGLIVTVVGFALVTWKTKRNT